VSHIPVTQTGQSADNTPCDTKQYNCTAQHIGSAQKQLVTTCHRRRHKRKVV